MMPGLDLLFRYRNHLTRLQDFTILAGEKSACKSGKKS
jgi:hypothetical protein